MRCFQITERFRLAQFNEGILFFVIIATNLLMMAGLFVKQEHPPGAEHVRDRS